ncbi:MAG: DUF362 domain-containing protein [bacterium]
MKVGETCVGCGSCVDYCPVGAISLVDGQAQIDQDECVECGVCLRAQACPVEALYQPELTWPRVLRSQFSDPVAEHPLTGVRGRGTAEMKTNDVTGRFKLGFAGIGIEVGRPGIGTRLREVEKIYREIVALNVQFEADNPVRGLIDESDPTRFKSDVLDEKVLSAIIEFIVPTSRVPEVLARIKEVSQRINTVISICLIDRVSPDGKMPNYQLALENGYSPSINAKVNAGLGKPLAL